MGMESCTSELTRDMARVRKRSTFCSKYQLNVTIRAFEYQSGNVQNRMDIMHTHLNANINLEVSKNGLGKKINKKFLTLQNDAQTPLPRVLCCVLRI